MRISDWSSDVCSSDLWQNDVTAKDILLATREGFTSIEHVKRYTTTGMATDQGKLSNLNKLGIVAGATGRTIPQIGLTTFRTPYRQVSRSDEQKSELQSLQCTAYAVF